MKLERMQTNESLDITSMDISGNADDFSLSNMTISWNLRDSRPAMEVGERFAIHTNLGIISFNVSAIFAFAPSFVRISVSNVDVIEK